MKKILIVNNNMDAGGIQKALVNLLKELHTRYDFTVLLFSKSGALMQQIPKDVKIVSTLCCYKMLGLNRKELIKYPHLFILKAIMKGVSKAFGNRIAMKILGLFSNKVRGYDTVISFSHLTNYYNFDNGCAEFVIDNTVAPQKICFVHCDYYNSGYNSAKNNALYHCFDNIVCVSESVKKVFLNIIPDLEGKTVAIRNFYDFGVIEKAHEREIKYDRAFINLLIVARLSPEKGIDRALRALKASNRKDIILHIVGDGHQKEYLLDMCGKLELNKLVVFYGEQENPYPYIANADYLFVPSLHEAAPIVYDEAHILNIPILSTRIVSTREMLYNFDLQCDNCNDSLVSTLKSLQRCNSRQKYVLSNSYYSELFANLIEGNK